MSRFESKAWAFSSLICIACIIGLVEIFEKGIRRGVFYLSQIRNKISFDICPVGINSLNKILPDMCKAARLGRKTAHCLRVTCVACVATVSFPFPGGDRRSERKAGELKSTPGVSKKLGRSGERVRKEGGRGGGRKELFRTPSKLCSLRVSFSKRLQRRLNMCFQSAFKMQGFMVNLVICDRTATGRMLYYEKAD